MSLKYGQCIRIKSLQRKGFITSKSYTDPNLYFQIYNNENSYIINNTQVIDIENYRQSLFQILPTSSFQINDEMNSMKSQAKKAQSAPRAKTQQQQFKAIIAQKRGKQINFGDRVVFKHLDSGYFIYGSFDCARSGIGAFRIDLRPQLSEKLIFQLVSFRTYQKDGDSISLDAPLKIYHNQTQCYLSYVQQNIFIDRNYKYDRQGNIYRLESIPYPYLKIFRNIGLGEEERMALMSSNASHDSMIMPQSGRFQIINQNITKRVWRLEQHLEMQMKPNKAQIRNHDIVYFMHTKDDKYLCPDNFTNEIFLKKRKGQPDIEQIFDGLWEIQQRKQVEQKIEDFTKSKRKTPTNNVLGASMRSFGGASFGGTNSKINISSSQNDEAISSKVSNQKYIIRHLMSGRILYASRGNDTVQLQNFSRDSPNKPVLFECVDSSLSQGALVNFKVRIGSSNMIKGKRQIKVLNLCVKRTSKKLKKNQQQKIDQQMNQQESLQIQEAKDTDPIQETYQSYFQKQPLQLNPDSSQHGFRIYKVDQEIKQTALFIMSSQQLLCKLTSFLDNFTDIGDFLKDFTVYFLNNIINVMRSLIGFVYNCEYQKIAQSGNSPVVKRQRAFDQLGMIELVTHLVSRIDDKSKDLKKIAVPPYNKQSEYTKIRYIYVLGYEILESMAAGNYIQKIRISKYLKKYLDHILQKENRVVYKSLQEVLDDNYLALSHKIDDEYIKELINKFDPQNPDPADLQFLSRICLCKERTVVKNQIAVFQNFYKDNQNAPNKFKFRQDQGKMQISSRISQTQPFQFRTLPQMYEQCEISQFEGVVDPQKGHWNYFLQYLNLLADVCVLRNNVPLTYIINNLPLKTLVYFLKEAVVRKRLLFQPFIRLVHHAFIQNKKYQQMNRITKVKDWNKLNYFQIPKTTQSIQNQLMDILYYNKQYIQKINLTSWQIKKKAKKSILERGKQGMKDQQQPNCIQFDPSDPSKLKMVKTFLEVLKSTLSLGFWPSMQILKGIVPYILKILQFDIEYANREVIIVRQRDRQNGQNRHLSDDDYIPLVYSKIKQQLTLNKPNINNLVQCKYIAAQILQIICDYQYNIKVSMITKYFKDVIENQIDLSKYNFDRLKFLQKWCENKQFIHFVPDNQKEGFLMIEDIWIDKIKQMIDERDLFSECKDLDKYLVFFETFIYQRKQLSNLVLSILTKISNQRKNILNAFRDIIIVTGGSLSKLAQRVLVTRTFLLPLADFKVRQTKITSSNNPLWGIVKTDARGQSNDVLTRSLGAIQQLAFLTMAMKKNGKPTPIKASKFYQQNDLYPFKSFYQQDQKDFKNDTKSDRSYLIITQKQENDPLNQSLIKSQDHHNIIIDFIKIMTDLPEQFSLPIKGLHAAYNFLTVLVWNNIQNKQYLFSLGILKITECHLAYNVGCVDFYRQMYTNNKSLVIKSDITGLVNKVIQIANSLQMYMYHKSKLMDFLRVLVIFDDKGVDRNQNILMQIISLYQVSDNNRIVFLKTQNALSKLIQENYDDWIKQYQANYKHATQEYQNLNIGPQLFYIATFFEIFSALIQNQNRVNIGKCNNMHPHDFLLQKIAQSKYCWPVVRHLRAYMNKLYYFPNREKDTQLFQAFIQKDLQNIKNQLRGIVELKCNCPEYYSIKIINPVRYAYLASYIYLTLEEILHSIDLMFKDPNFCQYMTAVFNQVQTTKDLLYFRILDIIQMLQYLQKTMEGRYINNYMSEVSNHLKKQASLITLQIIEAYHEKSRQEAQQNARINLSSSDDVPFKKRYFFHQSKGFWRHLIDWNAFHQQQMSRQRMINNIQKKSQKDGTGGQSKQSGQQKKKQMLLDLIALGNIQKKIARKTAKKKNTKDDILGAGAGQTGNANQQQMIQDQVTTEAALPKNLVTSKSTRFRIKNQRFSSLDVKNIVINNRRKKLVKFIQINPQFKKFSREQTEQTLYLRFNYLNDDSRLAHGIQVVAKKDVIKSIVKMNKLNPNSIQPQYKLVIIELLTNFILRQSSQLDYNIGNVDFWQLKQEDKANILQAQIFLNECGCSEFVCSLLMNDFTISTKMSNSIVLFAIMMLIGKNTQVQNTMLQLLKKDDKNIIFVQLQKLIKDCTNVVTSNAFDPVEQQYVQVINYADTYDFYNIQDNCMKRKFKFEPITIMQEKQFTEKYAFLQTAFIFLKVLCEGNGSQIKNYIRQQTYNDQEGKVKQQSVNFISLAVSQLKKIFETISLKIIKVPFSIVDFLNQVTQIPCIQNQIALCSSSFFHDFCKLSKHLQSTQVIPFTYENLKILNRFYSLNFKNILSCLEGNRRQIIQYLSAEDLSFYYVNTFAFEIKYIGTADQQWKNFNSAKQLQNLMLNKAHHKNLIIDLFQITAVILKLKHLNTNSTFMTNINYQLKQTNMKDYFSVFERNMLGIQVHVDSFQQAGQGMNQLIFFPRHAVFNYLSRQTRNNMMQNINRSTQRDKINGLIKATSDITEQITYGYQLDHNIKLFNMTISISSNKIQIYKKIGLFLATLLCVLLPILTTVIYYPQYSQIQYYLGSSTEIIQLLALIQFSFASIYLILWLKNRVKLAQKKYDRDIVLLKSQGKQQSKISKFLFKLKPLKYFYCLYAYDGQLSGVGLFMAGSFFGTFYAKQYFSILLINVMMSQMDVLKNVIAAITTNMKMLGMLSMLGTAFVAIFSIFGMNYYVQSLYEDQTPKNHCETMLDCIVQLYIREQIGNDMDKFQSGRFFFDLLYTIFMDTLFGNIVGGILIDTFAQLRDKRNDIENDKKGRCFICGIERQTLQKKNEDLKTHYKSQYHKLWDYNQQTKTGLQSIIEQKVNKDEVTWIPSTSGDEADVGQKIIELENGIKKQTDIIMGIQGGTGQASNK